MVSICISLMVSDVGHLYMCLLVIWIFSLEKYIFGSFFSIFIFTFRVLICFMLLSCVSSLCIWVLTLYQTYGFQIFSPNLQFFFFFHSVDGFLFLCRSFLTATPLLGIYPRVEIRISKRYQHYHVRCSTIHNSHYKDTV